MPDSSHDRHARAQALVGTTLSGKWKLDALLGVGGMAAVYAATHRNRKRVAVKVLRPEHSANPAMRERFLREGYVANTVGHPAVVSVDDDDIADDGSAFLVMELLEGEALDERMDRKGGRLPAQEVLAIADQLLEVLSVAHDKGILHRDIKPENLFLTTSGVIKVLDFGIARIRELSSATSSTQTGSLMGTPAFMAPEQARGRWSEVDVRTDLWAVGATMFFLLSGRPVHEADTANETLARVITERARPLESLGVNLSKSITTLVNRALSYEKSGRFQSAQEMREAVLKAHAELTGGSEPPPRLSIVTEMPRMSDLPVILGVRPLSVHGSGEGAMASALTLASTEVRSDAPPSPPPKKLRRHVVTIGLAVATIVVALVIYRSIRGSKPNTGESLASVAHPTVPVMETSPTPLAFAPTTPAANPTGNNPAITPATSASAASDSAAGSTSASPSPKREKRSSASTGRARRSTTVASAEEADPFAKRR